MWRIMDEGAFGNPDSNGVRLEWTLRDDLLLDDGEPTPQEAQLEQVYAHLDRIYAAINHFREQFGRTPSVEEQLTMIDALAPP
jgi:hypothetical protein